MNEPYVILIPSARGGKTDALLRRVVEAVREAMPAEVVVRGEFRATRVAEAVRGLECGCAGSYATGHSSWCPIPAVLAIVESPSP